METIAKIRAALRSLHNCIFLSTVYCCLVISLRSVSGDSINNYWPSLLICVALISLLFVFCETILVSYKDFLHFTLLIIAGNAVIIVLSTFLVKNEPVFRTILILFCIVIASMIYYEHNTEKMTFYPSLAAIGAYIVFWLFGTLGKSSEITRLVIVCQIIEIFIYLIYHELTNLEFSMNQVKDRAYVPVDMINYQNKYELFFFLIPVAAVTGLCFLFPYGDKVAGFLFKVLTAVTRFVVDLMSKNETPQQPSAPEGVSDMVNALPPGDMERWQKFWDVVFVLATIFVFALIIWAVVRIIMNFYRRFQKAKFQTDKQVSEFLAPEEKKGEEKAALSEKLRFFDRSPDAKIRRAYIRFIKKQPEADGIARYHTPRQIEERTLGDRRSNYERLHELYEKARYSHDETSAAEYDEAKKLVHR